MITKATEKINNLAPININPLTESLENLQKLHYSILLAIPHAVIGLKDRIIIFANESVENVFGWKPAEIVGKSTRILYRSEEDYEKIGKHFYPILEEKKTHTEDFPCIRKDGKEILCRITASVIGEKMTDKGIVVMYEDITQYKKVEANLIESERKYRELVENANSIILRLNSKGVITFINEFGQEFFGYSKDEIIGKNAVGTIVPVTESTGRDLKNLIKNICENPKAYEENINENMKKDGSRIWIQWHNKAVFDEKGNLVEVLSIGSDITERIKLEKELNRHREHLEELVVERTKHIERLNAELKEANKRLQELDRLKSMFIASMSHELRTPLNSIIGFIGMTLQGLSGELNEEQKDNLERAYRSAKHLLSLISDIIDISKIEAGKIDSFIEEVSLKDTIKDAIKVIEPLLKDNKLYLKFNLTKDIKLYTDKKRLLQCMINLLSNGAKYTESGGITIKVKKNNENINIFVIDTGIGISEKDMPKLFEAFERIDTHLRFKAGGTGLGLYLTRKIVKEILKGDISVKSKEGKGSTFILMIPKDLKKHYEPTSA